MECGYSPRLTPLQALALPYGGSLSAVSCQTCINPPPPLTEGFLSLISCWEF